MYFINLQLDYKYTMIKISNISWIYLHTQGISAAKMSMQFF